MSATHSGDAKDYSVLPIDELLHTLEENMESRFPGYKFESGYADHAFTSGCWTFPAQKEDLLGTYAKTLAAKGQVKAASRMVPGIRFLTSDTGAFLLEEYGALAIHLNGDSDDEHRQ